jgi:hypothetical protein
VNYMWQFITGLIIGIGIGRIITVLMLVCKEE